MLNANILSHDLRRTSLALGDRVNEGLKRHALCISVVTRAQLRFGQMGMTPQDRRRRLIDSFFLRLPCIEWGIEAADRFGALRHALKIQGTPIGDMDTLIAVHALAEKLILVTHNTRHFEKIPGLVLEDWMA